MLRAVLSWAVETGRLDRSPCRGVHLPELRDARPRVDLGGAEALYWLADAMPAEYRPAVYLGALGLRQAEVFGLRVGAVDFARGTLTVSATVNEVDGRLVPGSGKTRRSERTIAVPPSVLAFLGEHLRERDRLDPGDVVVRAPRGGPVRANAFRARVWRPATAAAGLGGLTFHRLRHCAIQSMREAGVPLEVASRRVGHSAIRTTADVYDSVSEPADPAVAADLDALLARRSRPSVGRASGGERI